jgi:hypothetical protein
VEISAHACLLWQSRNNAVAEQCSRGVASHDCSYFLVAVSRCYISLFIIHYALTIHPLFSQSRVFHVFRLILLSHDCFPRCLSCFDPR